MVYPPPPPEIRQLKKTDFIRKLNELLLKIFKIEEMNVDMRYVNLSKYMAFREKLPIIAQIIYLFYFQVYV